MGGERVTTMQLSPFEIQQHYFMYLLLIFTIQPFVHSYSFVRQPYWIFDWTINDLNLLMKQDF